MVKVAGGNLQLMTIINFILIHKNSSLVVNQESRTMQSQKPSDVFPLLSCALQVVFGMPGFMKKV